MTTSTVGGVAGRPGVMRAGLLLALFFALVPSTGAWAAQGDPRVRLEEPERGERRFTAPAAIPIEAEARAANGRSIARVEFFADGKPIGAASTAPYAMTWSNVPVGEYQLRARATDNRGATDWSPTVRVRVQENREPRVQLTAPDRGQRYAAPATVEFRAQARDRDHNLARVEFYANGVLLGSDATPRFRFTWTAVAAGTYNVMARAVDALGATDDSRVVTIVVTGGQNQTPSVTLTAPAAGSVFPAPGTVTLTANATDADGTIAKVDFYQGPSLIGTATAAPYAATVTGLAAGAYSFTAIATDNLGATAVSTPVAVAVNAAPTVELTSPVNNASYAAPATITLTATAADSDGTLTQVEFYQGATLVATVTGAPYTFTLSNVAAGNYSYTARAVDNRGVVTTSAAVAVNVNAAPSVVLTSPVSNAVFAAPGTITLTATAADSDGTVAKVDFYAGATLIGTATTDPYTFNWANVAAGSYTLSARVTDDRGAVTTSTPVAVTVNALPTVAITSPVNNATFTALANITVTAAVADAEGGIASVEFFNGASLIATRTVAPYSIVWSGVTAGSYSLTARVTDNQGAAVTSATVGVTVNAAVAQIYFIHPDHLNTPRLITNNVGQAVWTWNNDDPFGNNAANEDPSALGTFTCNLRLPGQYFDKETNLAYNYFRDYDAAIGRYVQSDPLGLHGGLNTFSYAKSDPLLIVDPYGLFCINKSAARIIAATAGGAVTGLFIGKRWQAGIAGGLVGGSLEGAVQLAGASDSISTTVGVGVAAGIASGGNARTRAIGGIAGGFGGGLQGTATDGFLNTTGGFLGGLLGTFGAELAIPASPYRWPGHVITNAVRGGVGGFLGGVTQDVMEQFLLLSYPCKSENMCNATK